MNTEEEHYSTANSEEPYYSTVNRGEPYTQERNAIEMKRNAAYEKPPQHSFQISLEENPAYEVGRPRTVN